MAKSRGYGSGGARTATPGKTYSNRTDLNHALPVTTAPGQQYGAQAQQAASQHIVPMASGGPPTAIASQQQQAATPSPLPTAGPGEMAGPGSLPPLDAPSARPHEPVTAGSPLGAGPGADALMGFQTPKVSQTIAQIAQTSGSSDLLALAQRALSQGN